MEINFKQTLFSLESRNRKCNDCGDDDVKYVSVNNGITLCELCAQIHKNFGNQISYLKSIDEEFDDYLMGFFIYGGNKKFRRTLKQMGVNLDVKKGHLYRTYGVDFYRRNLKSLVKGNSHLDKDYNDPNEVMKDDSNSFPEFNNYIVNGNNNNNNYNNNFGSSQNNEDNNINNFNFNMNNNMNNNTLNCINELNDLHLNIDLGYNNCGSGMINNPLENEMNNGGEMNNKDIEINQDKEKKLESVQNTPTAPPEVDNTPQNYKKEKDEDEDSAERRIKKIMKISIKGAKKLGTLMKKGGIKGYGIAKKYGKASYKMAKNYAKEKIDNFNKRNSTGKEEDKKE
jgi:hypothetical protein